MTYDERYAAYKAMLEPALKSAFGSRRGYSFDGLLDAMDYSLTSGGKRIRPVLTLEFARVCGGDPEQALPAACAVEMLHTYSLIHDDLPCMDDDALRRGRPTNHKVYGESTAVLAGDALQAEAFGTILRAPLAPERRAACARLLAGAAGVDGICGGQFMDMTVQAGSPDEALLSELQSRKTGSLLAAACAIGAAAAGAGEDRVELAQRYGAALGAAFQIRDDMLDALGTAEELGKTVGTDRREGKATFMTLFGAEDCAARVRRITALAESCAEALGDGGFLKELARRLAVRRD